MAASFACGSSPSALRFPPLPVTYGGIRRGVACSAGNWRRPSLVRHGGGISSTAAYGKQEAAVPMSVAVRVARELLQAGHHYLDIRTVDEFSAGHPTGAINVPYMLKVGSGLTKNPNFLLQVLSAFGKDDEIVIVGLSGCQSGKRSLMAAAELSSVGFTGITDLAGGFSAWVNSRLPTEQ